MTEQEIEEKNAILSAQNQLALAKDADIGTQIKIAAKLLGYSHMPPSITDFIDDEYYLGNVTSNLYPYWREQLQDIFPTPIHTRYPIVVITGAIGIGYNLPD